MAYAADRGGTGARPDYLPEGLKCKLDLIKCTTYKLKQTVTLSWKNTKLSTQNYSGSCWPDQFQTYKTDG